MVDLDVLQYVASILGISTNLTSIPCRSDFGGQTGANSRNRPKRFTLAGNYWCGHRLCIPYPIYV